MIRLLRRAACAALALPLLASAAAAQRPGDTVTVVAAPEYAAGPAWRWLLGSDYLDLWTAPVRVPVLDPARHAGGLTVERRGGGQQTRSLRMRGADGRSYVFRSVRKEQVALPPEVRAAFAGRVLEDQLKSLHPAGALVAPALLEAAGVPHATPALVVMPDHPFLGEHRAEFAGMLGFVEERADEGPDGTPGFLGSTRVVSTARLYEILKEEPGERIDRETLLVARVTDLFLGDWDRHEDQWRWARVGEGAAARWVPVPRDRDQAFVRYDGRIMGLVRLVYPKAVRFGPRLDNVYGMTINGRELDRRLLAEATRADWMAAVERVRGAMTDDVIDRAVAALPPEYRAHGGTELAAALRARRDGLAAAVDAHYRRIARQVDVRATDAAELARVDRLPDGGVEVRIYPGPEETGAPAWRRSFVPGETEEVRLHLAGGDDRVVVTGGGPRRSMTVRVIGGGGADTLEDRSAVSGFRRLTAFYDARGENVFRPGAEARVDTRPYEPPPAPPAAVVGEPWRDWGRRTFALPVVGYRPELGLTVGVSATRYRYGFRKEPFASRTTLRAGYATAAREPSLRIDRVVHLENSPLAWRWEVLASGMEAQRFHGIGNDADVAPEGGDDGFFRVEQRVYQVEPGLLLALGPRATLGLSVFGRFADADTSNATLLARTRPYGSGGFGQVGTRGELAVDLRDRPDAATRGLRLVLGGSAAPAVWDVEAPFATGWAEATGYLTAPLGPRPTLALRAGARRAWGDAPYADLPALGGAATLRGYPEARFRGDAAVYGSAEVRVRLARFAFVLPGALGVHALGDAGRVYVDGESPGGWHTSTGGGVWFQLLGTGPVAAVTVARGDGTRVYAGLGFGF